MIRRHRNLVVGAAVVAVLVVLYATGVFPELPDAKEAIEDIAQALGPWTYVLVGLLAFLETGAFVGLVAPGETTVIVGGVIAGQGEIELIPLIGLVWACCVLGDTTSFFIGRRLGRGFLERHGPKFKIDEKRLRQVESYFQRHGGKTILIGRFIGLVRALAPFVAGSSGLSYRRFIPFSVIGCGVWATLFTVLGFVFYRSFDKVAGTAGKATFAFGVAVAVIVGVVYVVRRLRREEDRRKLAQWIDRQGERRVVGPAFRALYPIWQRLVRPAWGLAAPPAQFLKERVTPGRLGLELTTAAAVAGVGAYVVTLYTVVITGGRSITPADRELLNIADDLYSSMAVDLAKVVTELGSFPTVAALVFATCLVLALRRRFTELAALLTGAVLIYAGVQLIKSGVDRPRPARPLTGTDDSSFPSGHAAYSTLWLGVAVVAARVAPGLTRRTLLVGAGLAIAVVVGLTRVYLRAHYWSDVAGGWGLGAAVLGTCAVAALLVTYFRNNHPTSR
jgi:undecaprenyl-diphosphatase